MNPPSSPRPLGRRPAGSDTRERIALEARRLFAAQGFKATSLRQIAAAAGVDVALIGHYFGSKQGLFDDLTRLPFDAEQLVADLLAGERERLGERLVLFMLRNLREKAADQGFLALLRSSGAHSEVGTAMKRHYLSQLLEPLARAVSPDEPELRAALCSSQLLGLSFAERVLEVEALWQTGSERLATVVGVTLQRYLLEEL